MHIDVQYAEFPGYPESELDATEKVFVPPDSLPGMLEPYLSAAKLAL